MTVQLRRRLATPGPAQAVRARRHLAHRVHRGPGPQRLRRHARARDRRNRRHSASASWKRSARPCAWSLCAAAAPCAARAPITKRSAGSRSSSPRRSTKLPAWWRRSVESARAGEKARRKLELELAAYQRQGTLHRDRARRGWHSPRDAARGRAATWRNCAPSRRTSRRSRRPFSWRHWRSRPRCCWPPRRIPGWMPAKLLKAALTAAGGRGGGNARIAQGSVPDAALLDRVAAKLASSSSPTSSCRRRSWRAPERALHDLPGFRRAPSFPASLLQHLVAALVLRADHARLIDEHQRRHVEAHHRRMLQEFAPLPRWCVYPPGSSARTDG